MKTRRPVFSLWFLTILVLSPFLIQTVLGTNQSTTSAPSSISLSSQSQSSTTDSSRVTDFISASSSTTSSESSVTATDSATVTDLVSVSSGPSITVAESTTTSTSSSDPTSTISDSISSSTTFPTSTISPTSTDGKSSSVTDTQANKTSTRETDLVPSASLANGQSSVKFTSTTTPLPTGTGSPILSTGSGNLNSGSTSTGSQNAGTTVTQSRVVNNLDIVAQPTLSSSDGGSQVLVVPSGVSSGGVASGDGNGNTDVGASGTSNPTRTGIAAGNDGANGIPTGAQKKAGSGSSTDSITGGFPTSASSSSTPSVTATPLAPISAARTAGRTKWIIVAAVFAAILLITPALICYRRHQRRSRTARRATEATPFREVEGDLEEFGFVGRVGEVKERGRALPVLPYRGVGRPGIPKVRRGEIDGDIPRPRPSVSSNSTTVSSTPTSVSSRIHRLVQALHSDSASRSGTGPPSYTNDVPPNYEVEDSLMIHAQ
ncbi:hypothetical protein L218DRAFT_1076610 [Marasmius fiardii PR-910]|nr:hypothetical protein L218DRAFT_1076610 [Marasmius fiardii PR-910]